MPGTLSVPHFRQHSDGNCLSACVQMVCAYYNLQVEQSDIADQMRVIPGFGVPGSRLRLLRLAGLEVIYRSGEFADLEAAVAEGVPPIVLVRTEELPYWDRGFAHAVVVTGIAGQQVLVNDLAKQQSIISVSIGDFLLAWDEMQNLYGLLRPTRR